MDLASMVLAFVCTFLSGFGLGIAIMAWRTYHLMKKGKIIFKD